jgi:hypothetical protein
VTAANESWYLLREPVQFAGDLYYPAGAAVFFNGNTMVRSGHYNGVPLYADATVEPFSMVLVPAGRGLMQPYVRPRPASPTVLMAAVAPTALPVSPGAISVYTPESDRAAGVGAPSVARRDANVALTDVIGTTRYAAAPLRPTVPVVSVRRPESNDGVWIMFGGEKWVSAGAAIPGGAADLMQVGEYAGFPVFAGRHLTQEVIYLPSRAGLMAPYRLKE